MKFKLLLMTLVLNCPLVIPHPVHAQALTTNAAINWSDNGSCVGTLNGQIDSYFGAIAGDTITINISNNSAQISVSIQITESGQATYTTILAPGGMVSPTLPVNSEIKLGVDGANCQSHHGGSAYYMIEAASGSMNCTIQSNQSWNVNLNFSNVINTLTMYRDSTYVDQFSNVKYGTLDFPVQFSAQSNAATYYLYYGSNSSARLLGKATCPAKVVSSSAPTSKSTTSNSQPTTNSPAAAATATTSPVQLTAIHINNTPVDVTKAVEFNQSQPLELSGHTTANGLVTLTIHSTPQTVTTTADANGNWTYTVHDLAAGEHYIESSVTDPTTKQTSPTTKLLSFKVDASPIIANAAVKKQSNSLLAEILIAVISVLGLALILLKKQQLPPFHKQVSSEDLLSESNEDNTQI